jgi:hypothetical protein
MKGTLVLVALWLRPSLLRGRLIMVAISSLIVASLALGSWDSPVPARAQAITEGQSPQATCPPGGQCFADVPAINTFYTFVNRLYQQDIITGYACGGVGEPCDQYSRPYYRPVNNVTRQQMAKFVDNSRHLPGIFINTNTNGQPIYSLTTLNGGIGLYGEGSNGTGVRGIGEIGVRGTGNPGVQGESTVTGGIGVKGQGTAIGVQGLSTNGIAVRGDSTSNYGVLGYSNTNNGVNGSSTGGNGVRGTTASGDDADAGVLGESTNPDGTGVKGTADGVAVWGESTDGTGVQGRSTNGTGVFGTGEDYGVAGSSNNGYAIWGLSVNGGAVYGNALGNGDGVHGESLHGDGVNGSSGDGFAGNFSGDIYVSGSCIGCLGPDKMDHPVDPANKYLYHSAVESPDMMNVYNGNITTDAKGEALVTLPDYFQALNRDFRYQLTVIGQFAQAIVSSKIVDNHFTIKTDKPNVEVSWQVTSIRNDPYTQAHPLQVEVDKSPDERGKYLHPTEYGQDASKGVGYEK